MQLAQTCVRQPTCALASGAHPHAAHAARGALQPLQLQLPVHSAMGGRDLLHQRQVPHIDDAQQQAAGQRCTPFRTLQVTNRRLCFASCATITGISSFHPSVGGHGDETKLRRLPAHADCC